MEKTNNKWNRGLAFKMILYIFSCIAIIFFLIFIYNYNISKKTVQKNLINNAEGLTSLVVFRIEKVLGAVQEIPFNFARIIESSDYSVEEMVNLLQQLVANNPEISGAGLAFEPYFIDPSKKYFMPYFYNHSDSISYKYLGGDTYDYFSMDWYQVPKVLDRPLWSEPYYDERAGNELMTTYSVPLYKNIDGERQLIGILGADMKLSWLQEYMNSIKICETGYGFMVSSNGTIVSHPNENLILNETIFSIADSQKSIMLRKIGKNMIHQETSFAEFEYRNLQTGKRSWIAYAPVPINNWSIGVVFPVDEFKADINKLVINLSILCLIGLLVILTVIILISRTITRPLRILTRAASDLAKGDFNIKLPEIKAGDEIGQLSDSFIMMQLALSSTINELMFASDQLKESKTTAVPWNKGWKSARLN